MAKKLNNIYLKENEELETHKILVDGDGKKLKKSNMKSVSKGANTWTYLRPIVIFLISAAVVTIGVFGVYGYVKGQFFDPVDPGDKTKIEVTVPKGASLSTISQILLENDIIRSKQVFKLYTDFSDMSSQLKAGTYKLSKSMDFDDIIYTLRKGLNTSPTAKVTLREGLSVSDYGQSLISSGVVKDAAGYLALSETGEGLEVSSVELSQIIQENKDADQKRLYVLEGYLFPDTYEFYRDAEPETIVKRQLARFDEIFTQDLYDRADELGMTVDEVVTLASIIEKEAKTDQFKQVSAVFHNRMKQDMPLQSDATMIYALGIKDRIVLEGEELKQESPYNTHLNVGLPIGPIGNPGKAALEAALYPDQTLMQDDEEYLFFTLTDPKEGELAFSKTNEEHQAIVDQWKGVWEAWDAEKAAG